MAPEMTISGTCKARPEAVYDLMANVQSHLEWAGVKQARKYRLLSLSGAAGVASVGTTWESTGAIPMSSRQFHDRSTVTAAEGPRLFEFRTEASVPYQNGSRMDAVFVHRYEIVAAGKGCRVSYTLRQESIRNGMWRATLPIVRLMTWKFGIPMMSRPGFKALLRMAEAAERQPAAVYREA